MILVCDKTVTPRAANLQALLLDLGCPAAVCAFSDIKSYLPVKIIITYCDVFDDLRHTPYDNIFALVIGDGFVNTALNAKRMDSTDMALHYLREFLYKDSGIDKDNRFPFGVVVGEVFFGNNFFEIYGNMVMPTDREYLIFKYLWSASKLNLYANVDMIQKYCYPASSKHSSNIVSVHISNLNRKIEESYGKRVIESQRFKGYYIYIK